MTRKDIEIMAPVGSYESLMAAIHAGANSVYFGVEQLNMRSKSSNNFTLDDLRNIASICYENGVKSYLTLNTVMYDHDLTVMRKVIDAAKASEVSAIIASDMAAISYARANDVEVHISTQLNVSNYEALKFYTQFADVVVLARELNMTQVKNIHKQIIEDDLRGPYGEPVKIEMFVHGALCMAISGKCYMSLHENNASANRGACQQTCRKAYVVTEKETGNQMEIDHEYIMSPKDLCTIGFLDKVIGAGVRVLKIEGRARSGEYVKRVVETYNEAVNAILDGTYSRDKIDAWESRLSEVFNRGFWDGYYLGRKMGEWSKVYGSKATKRKVYVGKVTNYFGKLSVAEVQVEAAELYKGDSIVVMGPTTGVVEDVVKEIRVDLIETEKANKGVLCSLPIDKVRRGDKLYKMVDAEEE
ncbi:peptidase U32 family protein [uncultured Acetobacteroides sp.]|uniref:peptidase U32 family protein n=1 Tax=uncultured Acetobacteroides sp. TaxID=1760811 RepID=UPI0029F4AA3B|nr:peptidase U32 family protein [uncultured Acetobacteroides sp.]